MIGYKHIDKRWTGAFLSGASIQLGSLAYYRNMEWDRADRTEGQQRNSLNGTIYRGDAALQALSRFGLQVEYQEANFENVETVEQLGNYLIFCCSTKPDLRLAREKGQSIIEIDLGGFVPEILSSLPLLARADAARVRYDKADGTLQTGLRTIDPFQKPKDCEWENEIRIMFHGYHSVSETVRLRAPGANRFMRLVDV